MRYRFAREGHENVIGQKFDVGAIKFDEDKAIPVTWMADFSNPDSVIGSASDIRRDDDGWLTAEIGWSGKMSDPEHQKMVNKDFFLTIYCNEVDAERGNGSYGYSQFKHVRSCRLRAIFCVVGQSDPWAEPASE